VGFRPTSIEAASSEGGWWIADAALERTRATAIDATRVHHRAEPLEPGAPIASIRAVVAAALQVPIRRAADAALAALIAEGSLAREGAVVRLPEHRPSIEDRRAELIAVAVAVQTGGATPPTIPQLIAAGHPRAVVDAAVRDGSIVRIAPDLVLSPAFVDRAVEEIRAAGANGMTVSELRERLGTSRKFAVPLVEYLDARGLTVRRGDVRLARGVAG
jgi:selenocysteine-specific elongation factor